MLSGCQVIKSLLRNHLCLFGSLLWQELCTTQPLHEEAGHDPLSLKTNVGLQLARDDFMQRMLAKMEEPRVRLVHCRVDWANISPASDVFNQVQLSQGRAALHIAALGL